MMRFHKNLAEGAIVALGRIFNEGAYADRALEALLKQNRQWGSRDRGFVAETVYEIVRWKRLYAEIAGVEPPYSREGLYKILGTWALLKGHPLPAWDEFAGLEEKAVRDRHATLVKTRRLRESVPDWLDLLGAESLGEEAWTRELEALNQQAPVVLRANTLRTSPQALRAQLEKEGYPTDFIEGYPVALQLQQRANVFKTKAFRDGWFEVQDASSQKVAPFLEAGPGMRVIDACAGAGGKTLHLAALMENKGQLLALDVYPAKLEELRRRARRAGAHNIEPRAITSSKVIKRLEGTADRVLIDAPCTGLGVLRRNPDAKWKLDPGFVETVCQTQRDLLQSYSRMVKPGGKVVYATCSILPAENHLQVEGFLEGEAGKGFRLVKEEAVFPSREGFDGFYMAQLERVG